jgi:glutamine amidotransferase
MADQTGRRIGNIIIARIRKASLGDPSLRNTHPFIEEPWAFAHNGTIHEPAMKRLKDIVEGGKHRGIGPLGETDSEIFFYAFLITLEEKADSIVSVTPQLVCAALQTTIDLVGEEHSGLNLLLSNGKQLYFYRSNGKDQRKRKTLGTVRRTVAEQVWVESQVDSEILQVMRDKASRDEEALLVASEVVSKDDRWVCVPEHQIRWIDGALKAHPDDEG